MPVLYQFEHSADASSLVRQGPACLPRTVEACRAVHMRMHVVAVCALTFPDAIAPKVWTMPMLLVILNSQSMLRTCSYDPPPAPSPAAAASADPSRSMRGEYRLSDTVVSDL